MPAATDADMRRAEKRKHMYVFRNDNITRIMPDGTDRVVPAPTDRVPIVRSTHEATGHWGRARTHNLLANSYWWDGMRAAVEQVVQTCAVCDRVRVSFNARSVALSPLQIEGLFYRWGVDLAGPFDITHRNNEYIMVAIEHFSKHLQLIPMPNKTAYTTAAAFRQHVFGNFGACAEVVTDQGTEFQGDFQEFLFSALVDHRRTSPNHPQANGLAERAVQSMKNALCAGVQAMTLGPGMMISPTSSSATTPASRPPLATPLFISSSVARLLFPLPSG